MQPADRFQPEADRPEVELALGHLAGELDELIHALLWLAGAEVHHRRPVFRLVVEALVVHYRVAGVDLLLAHAGAAQRLEREREAEHARAAIVVEVLTEGAHALLAKAHHVVGVRSQGEGDPGRAARLVCPPRSVELM